MGARSTGSNHLRTGHTVLLLLAIAFWIVGIGFVSVSLLTRVQGGGPACFPGTSCSQSQWYLAPAHIAEVTLGVAFLVTGLGFLVAFLYSRARSRGSRTVTERQAA